jgi:hypothetical protein
MTPSKIPPICAIPDAKPKVYRNRASVVPISIPRLPKSIFPITSQADLVSKIMRLFFKDIYSPMDAADAIPPSATARRRGHSPSPQDDPE